MPPFLPFDLFRFVLYAITLIPILCISDSRTSAANLPDSRRMRSCLILIPFSFLFQEAPGNAY